MRQTPVDQLVGARAGFRLQVLGFDALPGLVIDHCKLHHVPGLSVDKSKRGPALPETAHLSPTCKRACITRMVSRPFAVKTYSYRSGLVWYRRRSINP